ncbi:hypothetical protein Slin15195_G102690 [Septoria linicola]|uniref:Uncharacterized protein n=1 Tax=Septoria linicola TaxID=215465 RepID=A0A9Q9B2E7_9PEZI|nr:hypothetical protein Slin14017_G065690 [Septoria linicola]USW56950.1 hypothetical protein Slin15195_G102690 [Septoria linicola]
MTATKTTVKLGAPKCLRNHKRLRPSSTCPPSTKAHNLRSTRSTQRSSALQYRNSGFDVPAAHSDNCATDIISVGWQARYRVRERDTISHAEFCISPPSTSQRTPHAANLVTEAHGDDETDHFNACPPQSYASIPAEPFLRLPGEPDSQYAIRPEDVPLAAQQNWAESLANALDGLLLDSQGRVVDWAVDVFRAEDTEAEQEA